MEKNNVNSAAKNDDIFSVATLFYARLRRVNGRVIDVAYLRQNAEYAQHVLAIARESKDAELLGYVERLEEMFNLSSRKSSEIIVPQAEKSKKIAEEKELEHVSFSLF